VSGYPSHLCQTNNKFPLPFLFFFPWPFTRRKQSAVDDV
jgi:hypothetical protein